MTIEYREFRSGDAEALMQVWGAPDSVFAARFRDELVPSTDQPWIRSLVATDDGVPIAAGMVYTNTIHPGRYPAYIEVWETRRREGIGSALLAELTALAEDGPGLSGTAPTEKVSTGLTGIAPAVPGSSGPGERGGSLPLTAKLAEGTPAVSFAEARGFEVIQKSWVYVLAPSSMPQPEIVEGKGPQLEAALLGSVELSTMVQKFYNAVHASWSPSDLSVGAAQRLFLTEVVRAPEATRAAETNGAAEINGPTGTTGALESAESFGTTGAKGGLVYRSAPKSEGGKIQAFAISYEPVSVFAYFPTRDNTQQPEAGNAGIAGTQQQKAGNPETQPILPADLLIGYDPSLSDAEAETALSALLALVSYKDAVQIEVDESMTPLRAIVDRLNAVGALIPVDATCLIVAN